MVCVGGGEGGGSWRRGQTPHKGSCSCSPKGMPSGALPSTKRACKWAKGEWGSQAAAWCIPAAPPPPHLLPSPSPPARLVPPSLLEHQEVANLVVTRQQGARQVGPQLAIGGGAGFIYLLVCWCRWWGWGMWCGVVWCGVVWCGVVWCGVVCWVEWCVRGGEGQLGKPKT